MRLHVLVPGLLWPQDSLASVIQDLPHPALGAVLGRGTLHWSACAGLEAWLAQRFELSMPPPWAALRLLGEGVDAGHDCWICADFAHLRFARDALVMGSPDELALHAEEARALADTLGAHFSPAAQFRAGAATQAYLRLTEPLDAHTTAYDEVIGRRVDAYLPEGPGAARLRLLMNEAQMLLHAHPVNAVREAAGRAPVNSLWFWGAGRLPVSGRSDYAHVYADAPLVRGVARALGVPAEPLPTHPRTVLGQPEATEVLLVLDALHGPALRLDAHAWRSALEQVERHWLAPLLTALQAGDLGALHVIGLGEGGVCEAALSAQARWKFWRRPVTLAALVAPAGS